MIRVFEWNSYRDLIEQLIENNEEFSFLTNRCTKEEREKIFSNIENRLNQIKDEKLYKHHEKQMELFVKQDHDFLKQSVTEGRIINQQKDYLELLCIVHILQLPCGDSYYQKSKSSSPKGCTFIFALIIAILWFI